MNDLIDIVGENAEITRWQKRRKKAQDKLDKINAERVMPLVQEIAACDRVIAALAEHQAVTEALPVVMSEIVPSDSALDPTENPEM